VNWLDSGDTTLVVVGSKALSSHLSEHLVAQVLEEFFFVDLESGIESPVGTI